MKTPRPSSTAYLIASSTVFLARGGRTGQFVPPRAAELSSWFAEARPRLGRLLFSAVSRGRLRPLGALIERVTIPGIQLHYALRKRFLEEVAREALGDGFRQVVVLGAGFDTLALRLHDAYADALFVEADRPATQEVKKRVAAERRLAGGNLTFVAIDLSRPEAGAGRLPPPFDPGARTLFIAEGVLMYLAPAEVDGVFRFARRHAGPGSRFAFTFMEGRRGGVVSFRRRSRAVGAWLRLRGEPFKWGLGREALADFLAARGCRLRETATAWTLRRRYLAPRGLERLPLAEGEMVCVADFA